MAMAAASMITFSLVLPALDPMFSSRASALFFQENYHVQHHSPMLAAKLYVRGVSYYTGHDEMGVLTGNPKRTFYTKHAVKMFSNAEDLAAIDNKYFPIYCFLRPKDFRFLKEMSGHEFSIEILKEGPNRVLARINPAI